MKAVYERPRVVIEGFLGDRSVASASCTSETMITFDCLVGGVADPVNVLSSSYDSSFTCSHNAGYATVDDVGSTVQANQNRGHSTFNNALSWNDNAGTVTVKSSFADRLLGWLYICYSGASHDHAESYSTDGWDTSTGVLTHSRGGRDGCKETHACFAPVLGVVSVS